MKVEAVLQAVHDKLTGDATLTALVPAARIYTVVPQASDSGSDADFPYIVIHEGVATPEDTKSNYGGLVMQQVSIFDRSESRLAIEAIASEVWTVLHDETLIIAGADHVFTFLDSSQSIRDPDGKTQQIAQTFRIRYDNIS